MDRYHIALFLHIVALIVAAWVTGVTKLATGRRQRARTIGEVLDWHGVLMSASKLFPICLATFVITGGYMLSFAQTGAWSLGFVVAGLAGVGLLLASGIYLGIKGNALQQMLEGIAKRTGGIDQPAPKLVPPPVIAALPVINTGIALAVVFDMVTKPTSIPIALSVLVLGIIVPAAMQLRRRESAGGVSAVVESAST